MRHQELTERIIKGYFAVYNELGGGFLESVYENALTLELSSYGLKVDRQKAVDVYFRGTLVGEFRADMIVEDAVLVELKAAKSIVREFESQTLHYLKATGIEIGLFLNFGPKPEIRRFVQDPFHHAYP